MNNIAFAACHVCLPRRVLMPTKPSSHHAQKNALAVLQTAYKRQRYAEDRGGEVLFPHHAPFPSLEASHFTFSSFDDKHLVVIER